MTRRNRSLVWWSYLLLTTSLLVASDLTHESTSGNKSDVTTTVNTFYREHNRSSIVQVRPTEKPLPEDSFLDKTTRSSMRLAAKNRSLGLADQTNIPKKEIDRGSDNTSEKAIPLQPDIHFTFPPITPKPSTTPESCLNRCSNRTRFASSQSDTVSHCHCDSSCDVIFTDCCSDYTQHCGSNVNVDTDAAYLGRSSFQCVTRLKYRISQCFDTPGVWMISRCPKEWSNEFVRERCHAPSWDMQERTYDSYVPVYSRANQLTYRNQYCAICHGALDYELWSLVFDDTSHPAEVYSNVTYNLTEFLAEHAPSFLGVKPKDYRLLRYCFFTTVIKTCPQQNNSAEHERCVNGSVEIVSWPADKKYYKNRACASCHGVKSPNPILESFPGCTAVTFVLITHAVDLNNHDATLRTTFCPRDQVFDPHAGACRRSYRLVRSGSRDVYRVVMSLLGTTPAAGAMASLRDDLAGDFALNRTQIKDVQLFVKVPEIVVAFTLRLTPLQSVIVASGAVHDGSGGGFRLRRLFRFTKPFSLKLFNDTEYTVYHLTIHRLNCIHSRTYSFHEYVVLHGQQISVKSTGVVYERGEYERNASDSRPSATVCLKLAPSHCNGSYISLVPSEYDLLPNLTLVYHSTRHDFGEYVYKNGTVTVCVGFSRTYQVSSSSETHDEALTIVNLIGFIFSVICLFILITTYSIFKELRALPGKNLMSLAISLALAELFWLCSSLGALNQALCTALAIANHYFFLVYFTASSVIAFHTCLVFGRSIVLRRSHEENMRTFVTYSLVTWGLPALFVLTFSLLDHYKLFLVNYGGSDFCWLGTTRSKLYLFVLPFGALLAFNLLMFVHIAFSLCRNRQLNTQALGNRARRDQENIMICIKLSSLMGFSWLFVLLHNVVKSKTDAFRYLFVIFVSLQGVFVSVAFCFNRKCFKLYRRLLLVQKPRSGRSTAVKSPRSNLRKGNEFTQETKL